MVVDFNDNRRHGATNKGKPHSIADERRFVSALNTAIRNDELRLHYQPRYNALTGTATMVEALVRWKRPDVGLLYPEVFLNLAEDHGLIFNLDLWVFEQCCKDLLWLRENIDGQIKIAVNISVRECESMYHAQKLIALCEKYGVSFSDFELEITESHHTRDFRKVKAFCDTLANMGAMFSLDDFGTGQSPLSNLCQLPINLIKIDRSFVRNLDQNGREQILIKNLINTAHDMQIETVAEGVELEYQRDMLVNMGCDQLQGYYLCKPMERDALSSKILVI